MAKPKFPKKSTNNSSELRGAVSSTIAPPPASSTDLGPAQAVVAAALPKTETIKTEPKKTAIKKVVKKPELVKTDSRATLVPINLDDEIRRLAYLFSERRGFAPGHESEDWLAAEHEVRQRYHQPSAKSASA